MICLSSLLFRLIVPSVQLLVINMHWIKVAWHNVLDTAISPFFREDSSEFVWKNMDSITEHSRISF